MSETELVLRAVDSNVFDSAETAAGYLNPQIWNTAIEKFAMDNLVVAPLGVQNTELLSRPGYQLNIAVASALTASALTETTAIAIQKPVWTQVTVTPSEYGSAFQITRKELDRAFVNLLNEKAADAGYALARIKDSTIISALVSGATSTIYPNSKTAVTALATTDIMDTDVIADARKTLRALNRTGLYLVIHPYQEARLAKNSNFIDASVYGGREAVLNGEIGKYLGIRILVTNLVSTTGAGAGSTTLTAYQALLLGPRAFVVAQKRRPTIDSKYEPLDRAWTVAYVEDWGASVLNANEICVIRTAA